MMKGIAALVGSADPRTPMNSSFAMCSERDAQRAELGGTAGLRRAAEDVAAPADCEFDEARRDDGQFNLSFQESTGNSTSPERDVLLGVLRNRLLDQNVADLQAAARLEHPRHLTQRGV